MNKLLGQSKSIEYNTILNCFRPMIYLKPPIIFIQSSNPAFSNLMLLKCVKAQMELDNSHLVSKLLFLGKVNEK